MGAGNRVAYDARYINDRYHGIGRFAFRLLENLVTQAPEREFVVFKGTAKDSRFDWSVMENRPNVEVRNCPWPLYLPQEQFVWPWILRKSHIDLFFSPSFPAPIWGNVPNIITVHDLIFDHYPAYMPSRWAYPYYRLLMRLNSHRASTIIAVSKATANDLLHYYPVPVEKVVVIHEGVDPHFEVSLNEASLQKIRERYCLAERYILAVGARRPHKNFTRLVHAFASIGADSPYELIFVGPPDNRFPDEACEAASISDVDERVRFLNWVPETDLPGLYSMATLVVLPSLLEGFGLPALEAMACGAPVLVSNSSAFPELVGQAGLLVDPNDTQAIYASMLNVLQDECLRARLKTAGRKRASSFTWESTARRVLDVFGEVVR